MNAEQAADTLHKRGGTAFPTTLHDNYPTRPGDIAQTFPGMTVRDWFATHAGEEDIAAYREFSIDHDASTLMPCGYYKYTREQARYRFADAMLAERAK